MPRVLCLLTGSLFGVLGFGSLHEKREHPAGRVDLTQHAHDGSHVLPNHVFRLPHLKGRGATEQTNK